MEHEVDIVCEIVREIQRFGLLHLSACQLSAKMKQTSDFQEKHTLLYDNLEFLCIFLYLKSFFELYLA